MVIRRLFLNSYWYGQHWLPLHYMTKSSALARSYIGKGASASTTYKVCSTLTTTTVRSYSIRLVRPAHKYPRITCQKCLTGTGWVVLGSLHARITRRMRFAICHINLLIRLQLPCAALVNFISSFGPDGMTGVLGHQLPFSWVLYFTLLSFSVGVI